MPTARQSGNTGAGDSVRATDVLKMKRKGGTVPMKEPCRLFVEPQEFENSGYPAKRTGRVVDGRGFA